MDYPLSQRIDDPVPSETLRNDRLSRLDTIANVPAYEFSKNERVALGT